MKSNALKLSIGISIYLLLAGNTWSATVYQCVNEAKEISFSNQPCGESETLVKEHEIDENTNVIGSGATTQTPGTGTSTGTSPTVGTGSTSPAGGAATLAPAAGGGSRAGGGGGGSSAGGSGTGPAGGPAASTSGANLTPTPGTTTAGTTTPDAYTPTTGESEESATTPGTAASPASTEVADSAAMSDTQSTTTGVNTQATSVSTPLASSVSGPTITKVEGSIFDGQIITIRGINFSEKQRAKPLFFWSADEGGPDGSLPSPSGFKTSWDNGNKFEGQITQEVVASGSEYAVKMDHGATEGAMLGRIDFDSDRLYVWRKTYDAFDPISARAIRSRYTDIIGPLPVNGQIIRGVQSGATGIVSYVNITGTNKGEIFYQTTGGTINEDPPILMKGNYPNPENAELMEVYANDGSGNPIGPALATMLNAEGYGTYFTFNNKILRLWVNAGSGTDRNNMYLNIGGGTAYSEHTGVSSYFWKQWENQLEQIPYAWTIQEIIYQSSSIDSEDGITQLIQNGVPGWSNKRFRHRTSSYPNKYRQLFQFQVSNGAQPNSWRYMDSLYVDDTWHKVILCSASSLSNCSDPEIQLPTLWTVSKIQIKVRLGGLSLDSPIYLHISDGENIISPGFKVH